MPDESPKDYSSLYREGPKPSIKLDGARSVKSTSESTVDLRAVAAKLQNLPQENRSAYAIDTLNRHYSSVFENRRKSTAVAFKAHIRYFDDEDTYVVRLARNTLGAMKERLPKRGNYRYFFKQADKTLEEIEHDESSLPYYEKGDSKYIYCRLFPTI